MSRSSSRHHTTSTVSPNVQTIAMPEPLSGSARGWARTGTATPKTGVITSVPNSGSVALVVGMGDQCDARRQQLGSGRLDLDRPAPVGPGEADPVVGTGRGPLLELGLGDGGLEVDVPHGGRVGGVGLAPGQVAQEGALGHPPRPVVDGGVVERPVDREAHAAEHRFERALVLGRLALAQLEEVAPGDEALTLRVLGELEVGVVGERRVAADAEVVLHPALGGQAVVVPAHRVEDLAAAHAVEPGQRIDLDVAEHGAEVELTADRGRRRVDGVDLGPVLRAVEAVGVLRVPDGVPLGLETLE